MSEVSNYSEVVEELVQRSHITSHVRGYGIVSGYYARPYQSGSKEIAKIDTDMPLIINGGDRGGIQFDKPIEIEGPAHQYPELELDIDAFPFLSFRIARVTVDGYKDHNIDYVLDETAGSYENYGFGRGYHRSKKSYTHDQGTAFGPFLTEEHRKQAASLGVENLESAIGTLVVNLRPAKVVVEPTTSHFEFEAAPRIIRQATGEVKQVTRQELVRGIFRERLKKVVVPEPVFEDVERSPLVAVDYFDPVTEPANGENTRLGNASEDVSILRFKLKQSALTMVSPTEIAVDVLGRQKELGMQVFIDLFSAIRTQKKELLAGSPDQVRFTAPSLTNYPYALDIQTRRMSDNGLRPVCQFVPKALS